MLFRPKNNIDFIRMVAALFVLYSHQHALMGLPEPSVLGAHSLGGFGVLVFFSISGFLVAQSWHADPSFYRFALKRMLRIWPAMAVAVLLAALVLGPMVSKLPLREYYAHPLIDEYLLNLQFTVRDALPLQFTGSAIAGAVNGSLWTIPLEVKCYAALLLLGVVGALRIKWVAPLLTLAAAAVYFYLFPQMDDLLARFGQTATTNFLMQFSLFFFAGVSLYSLGIHHLSARAQLAAGALVLVVASLALLLGRPLLALWLTIPTLTLLFGITATPGVRSAGRFGDMSYGIYIYAFPVQQTFIWLYKDSLGFWQLLAASAAVTVVLAFLSWHLVENPALRFKPKRRRTAPQIAEAGSPYQVDPAPLVMQAMVQVLGNR